MSRVSSSGVAYGQGALIAIAVTMLIALVLGSTALTGLMQTNSTRTVVVRQSLQTYYIAQAGIQEALATRMLPRSNTFNFKSSASPYNAFSGLVYRDPENQTGLIGAYQYVILGGDPSRKSNGDYYANGDKTTGTNSRPRLITFQSSPPDSPFYIVSRGFTCKTEGGKILENGLNGSPAKKSGVPNASLLTLDANGAPTCSGSVRDELTVVTKVNLEPENGSNDTLNQTLTFKDSDNITLPTGAFIPGVGWQQNFKFNDVWNHTSDKVVPSRLRKVVFMDFATYTIYQNQDVAGAGKTTVNPKIPPNASIMLYFDGPVDYRTLSDVKNDNNLEECKSSTSKCNVQLWDNSVSPAVSVTGMNVIPIMPYLTKVLLLAPLSGGMGTGKKYNLILDSDLKSFSGAGSTDKYTIEFETQ